MNIPTDELIVFPVEQIITSMDIENIDFYSHYMATKLAEKHYRSGGYFVFRGTDFENNFILYFNESRKKRYLDDYTKIKIGRSGLTEDIRVYCENMMVVIPAETVDMLLYLCRLCSYIGGPGFPDIVITKGNEFYLYYVLFDELQTNQKLFLVFAKIVGINVGIVEVSNKVENKDIRITSSLILSDILSDSRTVSMMDGIEEAIEEEKKKLGMALSTTELAQIEDEITWLQSEKETKPFHIFKKWVSDGMLLSEDLTENMKNIEDINSRISNEFDGYEKELLTDKEFIQLIPKKTEEFMKKKADIMQKKFGIGPSKSKPLLRFMEAR